MSEQSVEGDPSAVEIADELLYRSGKSVTSGDFVTFLACFSIPQVMETAEGRWVLETEDDVRQVFDNVRNYYTSNGVTDVARTVIKSVFIDEHTIGSTHVSRLLRDNGEMFRKPYPTYSVIQNTAEGWKVASCSYAILDGPEHNKALTPRSDIGARTES